MSLQYCDNCNKQIDLDTDVEHFDECTDTSQEATQGPVSALNNKLDK